MNGNRTSFRRTSGSGNGFSGGDEELTKPHSFPLSAASHGQNQRRKLKGVLKTKSTQTLDQHESSSSSLPTGSPVRPNTPKRVSFAGIPRLPSNQALSASAEDLDQQVDMSDLPASFPAPRPPPSRSSSAQTSAGWSSVLASCQPPNHASCDAAPAAGHRGHFTFHRTTSLLTSMLRKAAAAAVAANDAPAGQEQEQAREAGEAGGTSLEVLPSSSGGDAGGGPLCSGEKPREEQDPDEPEGWTMYLGSFGCSPDLAKEWA